MTGKIGLARALRLSRALRGLPLPGLRAAWLPVTGLSVALLFVALLPMTSVRSDEFVIEFFRASFLPQSVTVEVGDRVRFLRLRGTHRLRSGESSEDPAAGELFDVVLDEAEPEFVFEIGPAQVGGFAFFDEESPQVGFVEVTRGEQSFRVGVVDNVFIPERLEVFAGDSVRWEHEPMEAFHTVTSGRSSAAGDSPGELFDEESSDARPIFVYRFDDAGAYPYFCRPHEQLGMTGEIVVQEIFLRGDSTKDLVVDISNAVATLGFLFLGSEVAGCDDAQDSNDDGALDLSDSVFTLSYLFLGGVEFPAPFPLEGPDRSADPFLCGDFEA